MPRGWVAALLPLLGGCDRVLGLEPVGQETGACEIDDVCVNGAQHGHCDCGFCSYPATECRVTGRRWLDAAPGELGGACVRAPVQIDARVFHTCAVASDGTGWCWGWNPTGQLGGRQPYGVDSTLPVEIRTTDGV